MRPIMNESKETQKSDEVPRKAGKHHKWLGASRQGSN